MEGGFGGVMEAVGKGKGGDVADMVLVLVGVKFSIQGSMRGLMLRDSMPVFLVAREGRLSKGMGLYGIPILGQDLR